MTGLVLLELFDLYRKQGRDGKRQAALEPDEKILLLHLQEHLYAETAASGGKRGRYNAI